MSAAKTIHEYFGTKFWAIAKAMRAYHLGLGVERYDCHSRAGNWIARNEEALKADPKAAIIFYVTPSDIVAHTAVRGCGEIFGDVASEFGADHAGSFRKRYELPVSAFLSEACKYKPADPAPAYAVAGL